MKIIDLLILDNNEVNKIATEPKYRLLVQRKIKLLSCAKAMADADIFNYYLIENIDDDRNKAEQINDFVKKLNREWYEIKRIGSVTCVSKTEIFNELMNLSEGETIVITDFYETDYCGYAWITKNDNTYIEVRKGGFTGFWNSKDIPTHYLIRPGGEVMTKHLSYTDGCYRYDYEKGNWCWSRNKSLTKQIVTLDMKYFPKINHILRMINHGRANMHLAWIISEEELKVFDLYIPIGVGVME